MLRLEAKTPVFWIAVTMSKTLHALTEYMMYPKFICCPRFLLVPPSQLQKVSSLCFNYILPVPDCFLCLLDAATQRHNSLSVACWIVHHTKHLGAFSYCTFYTPFVIASSCFLFVTCLLHLFLNLNWKLSRLLISEMNFFWKCLQISPGFGPAWSEVLCNHVNIKPLLLTGPA